MPTKPTILGTGLNGLVGSRVVELLNEQYDWINLDIAHPSHPVDITKLDSVKKAVAHHQPTALLHCAAFTDVTSAWQQAGDKEGLCYRVNVLGTQNIAQVCQELNVHLIHLSTAYVFDGTKPTPYQETDLPNPIEWYGQTKLWAEETIQKIDPTYAILRIDQPFRPDPFIKLDAVHRVIEGLKNGNLYPQFTNHFFGPTFIDSLATIIDQVIQKQITGLYHATNNESWTDFDFASQIAELLGMKGVVKKGNLTDYLKTTNRPYQKNTALDSSSIWRQLRINPNSIKDAIRLTVASSSK